MYQRATETGTFTPSRANCGAPRQRRTPEFEEDVLHLVEEDATSTRQIAGTLSDFMYTHQPPRLLIINGYNFYNVRFTGRLNVDHKAVWRVLHEQQLYPYHPQKVQAMQPEDFGPRTNYCRWFLHRCVDEPNFPRQILFTDEAHFTREGVLNSHNSHMWADENSHAARPNGFQHRYGLNIWAGFLDGRVIGSYLLPKNITDDVYLRFLESVLHRFLEDVPLHVR